MPKTLAEDFADAPTVHLPGDAPKDGKWFVAKNRDGDLALLRWRKPPDLDPGEAPYFARLDTDEPFDFVAWAPSSWSYDDLTKAYG